MLNRIHIAMHERAVLLKGERAVRFLRPGVHWAFGFDVRVLRFDTRELFIEAPAEVRACIPQGELLTIQVGLDERAVLKHEEQPVAMLEPGRHFVWSDAVSVLRFRVSQLVFEASPEVLAVLPEGSFAEIELGPRERGLLWREGRAVAFLGAGRTRFWTLEPGVSLQRLSADAILPELEPEVRAVIPRAQLLPVRVDQRERVVLTRDEQPFAFLGPGQFWVFGEGVHVHRFDLGAFVFDAAPAIRAIFPEGSFAEVELGPRERAVLEASARPQRFLGPGLHRFWREAPDGTPVTLRRLGIDEPLPELTDELRAVLPSHAILEDRIEQHERGLLMVDGELVRELAPGRVARWRDPDHRVEIVHVDMRQTQLAVLGQELMSADKVSLRLNLNAEFRVTDAAKSHLVAKSHRDALYLAVQLAARDFVGGVKLDELLEGRDAMTQALHAAVNPQAEALGLELLSIGVKDLILPGEMKVLLNRVIEAEKEAAANVILRREETAATRAAANTAKVLADNPVLLRMKELEALRDIAAQIGELNVVVGGEELRKVSGFLRGL